MASQSEREQTAKGLIEALRDGACYPHPAEHIRVMETHISWVFLAGGFAYKVKKPVNLGFLDFSSLALRRFYCQEELRLNRRTAPGLYLDVVPIVEDRTGFRVGGPGQAVEYAVKMLRFPEAALLIDRLPSLQAGQIDRLAEVVADFHTTAAVASMESGFGTAERVREPVGQNFLQIRERLDNPRRLRQLSDIGRWAEEQWRQLRPLLKRRRAEGFIRECHGDLHLGNIALMDDRPVLFDCIEFNENLRWIDVMSDVAFLTMDLIKAGRPELANRFLNGYLETTGDYEGLALLPYYRSYRALVRAKVNAIRLAQQPEAGEGGWQEYDRYAELAASSAAPERPFMVITHGVSGSGKTQGTIPLIEACGAIRIRSDVERKRLFGLAPDAASRSKMRGGIYTVETTQRTYDRLADLAAQVVHSGHPVVVDATFLKREQRDRFARLAQALSIRFLILHFQADSEMLKQRVEHRQRQGRDASEANLDVLQTQLTSIEPLTSNEREVALSVDTTRPQTSQTLIEKLRRALRY